MFRALRQVCEPRAARLREVPRRSRNLPISVLIAALSDGFARLVARAMIPAALTARCSLRQTAGLWAREVAVKRAQLVLIPLWSRKESRPRPRTAGGGTCPRRRQGRWQSFWAHKKAPREQGSTAGQWGAPGLGGRVRRASNHPPTSLRRGKGPGRPPNGIGGAGRVYPKEGGDSQPTPKSGAVLWGNQDGAGALILVAGNGGDDADVHYHRRVVAENTRKSPTASPFRDRTARRSLP